MAEPVEVLNLSIVGNRVTERRKQLNISGSDCARFAGISEKTLYKIENGWVPKLSTALWLAAALATTIEALFVIKVKTRSGRRRKNSPAPN